jgi:hypothetical protein
MWPIRSLNAGCPSEKLWAQNSNFLLLPDLHSFDLFKGQPVPGSIINPGGRRAGMAGDPLRDLDCAARIHVFGDTRCTETVTTDSFQDPAGPRPFLNQLQYTPTIEASRFNRFTILGKGRKTGEHLDLKPSKSVQAKDRPLL